MALKTAVCTFWFNIVLFVFTSSVSPQNLKIYHIDVEQGDATLFVSPNKKTLLVDSGRNGDGSRIKSVMDLAGVDTINFFVCTHYHEDHYGGIDDLVLNEKVVVLKSYDRGDKNYLPTGKDTGATYKGYHNTVGNSAEHIKRGMTIPFDNISVTCISSGGVVLGELDPKPGKDENDMSISLLIQHGSFRYFIGGDIEHYSEQKIADNNLVIDVDVYQANHHGSNTSSSTDFMKKLNPSLIVISNGNNFTYKHPRQECLDSYAAMNPVPAVIQTNKYLKGGSGGNVDDDFIADLESDKTTGTVEINLDPACSKYTVNYRDKSLVFTVKAQNIPPSVVIASLLPDPVGNDTEFEEVTLKNKSGTDIQLTGWYLKDAGGRVWALSGIISAGESLAIKRNKMPMSLNNSGDEISLIDAGSKIQDRFKYNGSVKGVTIETGH